MSQVTVRKRGSTWEYRFEGARIGKKRQQHSKGGFSKKSEAMAAGIKALNEYNNSGLVFTPSEMSYSDLLDLWYKNYVEVNLAETTADKYEKNLRNHIKPSLGMYKLKAVTTPVLQDFINDKFKAGYSHNSLMNLKALLTASFNYAIDMGFINVNPATRAKLPNRRISNENTRNKERIALTDKQVKLIFERFPESSTSYIPLLLGYRCGLRIGETFALTWEDINFKDNVIDINKQIQWINHVWKFKSPKYDSCRKINIDSVTAAALKKYRKNQLQNRLRYGKYYTNIYINEKQELSHSGTPVDMVCRKENGAYLQSRTQQHTNHIIHTELNIPAYDYHTLRHTHATILLEKGAPIKDVQYRLGHKNIKETLDIYSHCTENMSKKSVEILEQIV